MTHTLCSARSAAAGILVMAVAAALAPGTTYAQSAQPPSRSQKGTYAGVSAGVYFETSESGTGQAVAGSGIIGYQFNARWAIQGELGGMGNVECFEAWVSPDRKVTVCDSPPILNLDAVRRFTAGSLRPYVAFGLGMGVHVGTGVEIPVGRRFAVVPAVDVNVLPDMLAVRPKVALLVRF